MFTEETIMEEMLARATDPTTEAIDELGVQMFCMVVRSDAKLINKALEMIVSKVRTSNVTQAIKAIDLLEECMEKCGDEFQSEVAKFRFLNDLIRLVSIKYKGAETPPVIKKRIMNCLLLWTTEFPQRSKIREAYDMLTKEQVGGSIEQNANPTSSLSSSTTTTTTTAITKVTTGQRESTLGIDEQLLVQLLHSGDPEKLQRANRLIQHRVHQETRQMELICQHKSELIEVQTTVGLLQQMLDTYEVEGGNSTNEETINLIRELYMACKKHQQIQQHLPQLIGNVDNDLVVATLETNDLLQSVLKRYKKIIVHPLPPLPSSPTIPTTITTTAAAAASTATDLLADLLGDTSASVAANEQLQIGSQTAQHTSSTHSSKSSRLDAFEELSMVDFGNSCIVAASNATELQLFNNTNNELLSNDELLMPTVNGANATAPDVATNQQQTEKRTFRELPEIDEISAELFKTSLSAADRVGSFKREPAKKTLNELVKSKLNSSLEEAATVSMVTAAPLETTKAELEPIVLMSDASDNCCTLSNIEKSILQEESDELMLCDGNSDDYTIINNATQYKEVLDDFSILAKDISSKEPPKPATTTTTHPIKHLSDIDICLDNVTPTSDELLLLDDDDIKMILSFTKDRPSKNVSVIVISLLNKSKLSINDFQFEASVKKPCKVRLLPPTDVRMPPSKPFRPSTPINQIMLLLNPTGKAVDVTCIVGYKLGDDPDPIKESIVAEKIPYVE